MKGFIIKYRTTIEGKDVFTFHSGISLSRPESKVMNVYTEHVTTKKEEAVIFYEEKEAQKVRDLFGGVLHRGTIIQRII